MASEIEVFFAKMGMKLVWDRKPLLFREDFCRLHGLFGQLYNHIIFLFLLTYSYLQALNVYYIITDYKN